MKCDAKLLILIGLLLIELAFLPNVSHTEGFIESAVGIWLFEDAGDKVIDSSGTGNNGIFKDGKVNRVKGKVGNGLEFIGEGFVEIPDSKSLSITETLTITAWVQVNSSFANQGFISKCDYGANQRSYLVRVDKDKFSFGFTQTLQGPWFWVADDEVLDQNTWYHVAATHDGEKISIYINGELANENAANSQIPDATTPLMFGVHGIAPATKFIGLLDEIGIFNTVLAADEIKDIMNKSLAKVFAAVEPSAKMAVTWGIMKAR